MQSQDTTPKRKANAGSFKPGPDARRHVHTPTCGHTLYKFTAADCSAGFWAGLAAYVARGGEARNFLRRKMSARGQVFRATPKRDRGRLPRAA